MWEFLKKLHLSVFALTFLGFIILIIILIVSLFSSGDSSKKVLKISLSSKLVELAPSGDQWGDKLDIPLSRFESKNGVINTVQALKKAKEDDDIASVFLDLGFVQGGLASVQEIRNAVIDFKTSGKKVIAYGDYMNEKAYYLASAADSIFLTEEAVLEFNGFVAEVSFYKKTLESIGVKPKIFRVGKFKGAVEPFLLDSMSSENRLQINGFLGSLHQSMLSEIALSRKLDLTRLLAISDSMLVRNPLQAKANGLIDDVKYFDEVLDVIKSVSGIKEEISYTSPEEYWTPDLDLKTEEIAVIVADGEIQMGDNNEDVIGSNGMAALIRKAREDKEVKAIVLRINSPGGSALGSDLMWREIKKASEVKPVICSMGDVAASGGYYMAMACDTILAHPTTITGSIGVFGMLFDASNLLEKKIGIHTDRVKTGKFSDIGTPSRAFTKADSSIIQDEVNAIYQKFVSKAADGRKMSFEDLEKIASGRVWSGVAAKENKLIDQFGGLDDAINIALKKINKEKGDIAILYYPTKDSFWGTIENGYKQASIPKELTELKQSELYQYYQKMNRLKNMKGVQAKMEYDLQIN